MLKRRNGKRREPLTIWLTPMEKARIKYALRRAGYNTPSEGARIVLFDYAQRRRSRERLVREMQVPEVRQGEIKKGALRGIQAAGAGPVGGPAEDVEGGEDG